MIHGDCLEELARLDQPQEPISIQLAQQLLSGGVPTVNQGVTDEFPQGGIAGPQQATQQAAAPQQGAAPQAAAPQAAPAAAPAAPAAGGQVPGMQFGGSLRGRLPERDPEMSVDQAGMISPEMIQALLTALGVAGRPAWNVGKKHVLPKVKEAWGGIKNLYVEYVYEFYLKLLSCPTLI